MVSQDPTTPPSAKSAAGDSSDLATTQAGKTSHDVAAKENPSKPDNPKPGNPQPGNPQPGNPQPKQSTTMTILLLVSVLSSTFLVALDRTIISTV